MENGIMKKKRFIKLAIRTITENKIASIGFLLSIVLLALDQKIINFFNNLIPKNNEPEIFFRHLIILFQLLPSLFIVSLIFFESLLIIKFDSINYTYSATQTNIMIYTPTIMTIIGIMLIQPWKIISPILSICTSILIPFLLNLLKIEKDVKNKSFRNKTTDRALSRKINRTSVKK